MNCVITWIQSERILESVLFLFVLDFSTVLSFLSLLSSLSLIIYYVGPGVLGNSKITSLRSLGCKRLTWTTTENMKKENLAKTCAMFMWPCEKPWPGLIEYWKWVWVQIPFLLQAPCVNEISLQGIKVIAFVLALNGTDTEKTEVVTTLPENHGIFMEVFRYTSIWVTVKSPGWCWRARGSKVDVVGSSKLSSALIEQHWVQGSTGYDRWELR